MATLVFTALGTALGGPLGGAIGALVGQQIDRAIIGSPKREGPRLKELALSTSTYGAVIPRHFGRVRAAGAIIWSTDLLESSQTSGGGKGQPSVKNYSYCVSLAIALSSRPILGLGRIWADGNLLRGAAGDLKTGGTMRLYDGHGDHPVDPLIASDKGLDCPGFRGIAYVVLEQLELAGFGNRIPALTFEIIADNGTVQLASLLENLPGGSDTSRPLPGLAGFSDEGWSSAQLLSVIDTVYPLTFDSGAGRLRIGAGDTVPPGIHDLPEAAVAPEEEGYDFVSGRSRQRAGDALEVPGALRYYDLARDYQSGLQRAAGRARAGREVTIEFPGTMDAASARDLANAATQRAGWSREVMGWRMAELDPALAPGTVARIPGTGGYWRVDSWEWRDRGVELELTRLPAGPAARPLADPGSFLPKPDLIAGPTRLLAFELPWDGAGSSAAVRIFAAASSANTGWRGAALYADQGGALAPLGTSGSRRSVIGQLLDPLGPSPALLFEPAASVDVVLTANDFALAPASLAQIAAGANRALIGEEIIQFRDAQALGAGHWRLTGLLRGRGGGERAASLGHAAGAGFVLLDDRPILLDGDIAGQAGVSAITAIGQGDNAPVSAAIAQRGVTLRPLTPVHPRQRVLDDGSIELRWTRRARGGWNWRDEVDVPLVEARETYLVGLGPCAAPLLRWDLSQPVLALPPGQLDALAAAHPGQALWVRQAGDHALSDPLLLFQLA